MRTILSLTPLCLLLLACASAGLPGQSGEPGNLAAALEPFVERQDVDVAIAYRNLAPVPPTSAMRTRPSTPPAR